MGGGIIVVASSEGSVGRVFKPGGGMNGGAPAFKDLPGASLPDNSGGITGVRRDLMATGSPKVSLPDGDVKRLSS